MKDVPDGRGSLFARGADQYPRGAGLRIDGQVVITDLVEHTIVPARSMPSQTYACAALEQKQDGLLFKSCGDEGDLFIPVPGSQ
jgi:hypothetical protein